MLRFYTSGFAFSPTVTQTAYGAGFDLSAALLRKISPWDEYETNHFLCVFVAELGLWGTWKLGRLLGGPLSGLFALLLLILTPVYYGHQFNNPKDIPFAVGYVWGLYFIARLSLTLAHGGTLSWRFWVGLGVVLALGMSVRLGGAVLVPYLFFALGLHLVNVWRRAGARALLATKGLVGRAALATLLAWALMTVAWPRALHSPVQGPRAAIETVSRFTRYDSPTLLAGATISSNHVPWNYVPTYFAVQLPELETLGLVFALLLLVVSTWRDLRARQPLRAERWLLAIAVVLPPAYAAARGSTLYNGLRHFLFLIPPMAVLAGTTFSLLIERAWRWRPRAAVGLALALAVCAADQAIAMYRLHPYEHVYFNRASGGITAAVERYETEYYGSVYRELLGNLREQVWEQQRERYFQTPIRVTGCGSKLFFTENLPLNFEYQSTKNSGRAHYYASYLRDECLKRFRGHELMTSVVREGATLAVARDLKRKKVRARANPNDSR